MMKKNILLIANRLDLGGAEVYVISIANRLAKLNYNVFVASSGGKLVETLSEEAKHFTIPADAKKIGQILSCSKQLKNILKENKIDLIHTNSVITCLIAKLAAFNKKITIVNTAHSWGTNKTKLSAKLVDICANKVIAVSKSTGESYIANGLNRKKVNVFHNGIDTDKFKRITGEERNKIRTSLNIQPEDFVIVNIARMEELRKGHNTLIEGAKIVLEKHKNCKFLLVGYGNLREGLEEKVKNYNIQDNVLFLGKRTDIVELLSASELFCLPSDWEGLPLVIAEAMSCQLPVIATAVNGVPEIVIDEETGYLIEPKNPEILAEKIITLIENTELREKMAQQSYNRALKHFSLDGLIEKINSLYNN
ncbi:MAG: glycosyltransferase family 4 protein [Vampirovibrionia bacterium]